jgi:hypothetical protein
MKAKQMFEKLGFNYYDGADFITIGKTTETKYTFKYYGITFNYEIKKWFAHINTKMLDGRVNRNHLRKNEIEQPILDCINKQIEELGWLDE